MLSCTQLLEMSCRLFGVAKLWEYYGWKERTFAGMAKKTGFESC